MTPKITLQENEELIQIILPKDFDLTLLKGKHIQFEENALITNHTKKYIINVHELATNQLLPLLPKGKKELYTLDHPIQRVYKITELPTENRASEPFKDDSPTLQ